MLESTSIGLICGAVVAVVGILMRFLYASKCNKVKCCGCEVIRDIEHEASLRQVVSN